MDYAAIATEIAKPIYAGMTDAQIATALMAITVQPPNVDVPVSAVAAYLFNNLKFATLKAYVTSPPAGANAEAVEAAALLMMIASNQAPITVFRTSDATEYARLQTLLSVVSADANSGLTATDETNLLALAVPAPIPAFGRDPTSIIDQFVVERARFG